MRKLLSYEIKEITGGGCEATAAPVREGANGSGMLVVIYSVAALAIYSIHRHLNSTEPVNKEGNSKSLSPISLFVD